MYINSHSSFDYICLCTVYLCDDHKKGGVGLIHIYIFIYIYDRWLRYLYIYINGGVCIFIYIYIEIVTYLHI